tara:strand:+ start:142 stop:258 length:117 start_codon:yes stop_codon:yes gene_type:complete
MKKPTSTPITCYIAATVAIAAVAAIVFVAGINFCYRCL